VFTIPIICIMTACGLDTIELGGREPWETPPPDREYTIPYHPNASCYIKDKFYQRCPENAADLQWPGLADDDEENDRRWTRD